MVWRGRVLAFVAVFFFAAAYFWAKSAMTWLPPFVASAARFGGAGLLLVPFAVWTARPWAAFRGSWRAYLALGFVGITCFQGFLFLAIKHTSVINVSVIMTLTPVLTALGAAAFLRESLTRRGIGGMTISVLGAMLAVLGDSPDGIGGLSLDAGELLALGGAMSFAFYTLAARSMMPKDIPSTVNTAIVLIIGAVFLLPPAVLSGPVGAPASAGPVFGLAALVLCSTFIAYLAWNRAIESIGVTEPNLLFNFIPIIVIALSALQGDPPWPEQIIGALMVIGGVTWSMLFGGTAPARAGAEARAAR